MVYSVVGLQYGDEGKGKVVDMLSERVEYSVRYQGGNNAGHTVVVGSNKFVLHLLPSGVLNTKITCLISSGVVVDLKVLLQEMAELREKGLTTNHILLSNRCHLIMPYHIALDEAEEEAKENKIGTTKRGIGPCYADKYNRTGLRLCDLADKEHFYKKLKEALAFKNLLLEKIYDKKPLDLDTIYNDFLEFYSQIKNQIVDSSKILHEALEAKKSILFEGAQAAMLDIDFGTYPYVTSSSPTSGGIAIGTSLPPSAIDRVIGITKAYTTRVGSGPFVTELNDEVGDHLVNVGHEFGSTTKRRRRTGWLDLVVLRHAIRMNGVTHLVMTKLDVLQNIAKLKVCVAYTDKKTGLRVDYIPALTESHDSLEPVYMEFEGFSEDISKITNYNDLPSNAKKYIEAIEKELKIKFAMVCVGPERNANIIIEDLI